MELRQHCRQHIRLNSLTIVSCLLVTLFLMAGCKSKQTSDLNPPTSTVDYARVATPRFNADSAYSYVAAQLAFGPRTPGSQGWQRCAQYLEQRMRQWCDTVIVQPFNATLWDGTSVPGRNIIASLRPQAPQRLLLGAHWDSRFWADHDPDQSNHRKPVPGANDGASGVAVLMELARVMSQMPPSVGIDFVFFDVEDQGTPSWGDSRDEDSWCKGAQHWARTPHVPYYSAIYGILLDMVGTHQPRFTKEEVSRSFAPGLTDKIWNVAATLGHQSIFLSTKTDPILDDHFYVNRLARIPMVDIVQNHPSGSFFEHWHTTADDLSSVNPQTLAIVAQVVLATIYGDYPASI